MNIEWETDKSWKRIFEPKINCSQENTEDDIPEEETKPATIFNGECMIKFDEL
jgi:hypothetical protein